MHPLGRKTGRQSNRTLFRFDGVDLDNSRSAYLDVRNSIEVLNNLVYLTRHRVADAAQVLIYMQMAEEELDRLEESAKRLAVRPTSLG
jgi:hypothetical protein